MRWLGAHLATVSVGIAALGKGQRVPIEAAQGDWLMSSTPNSMTMGSVETNYHRTCSRSGIGSGPSTREYTSRPDSRPSATQRRRPPMVPPSTSTTVPSTGTGLLAEDAAHRRVRAGRWSRTCRCSMGTLSRDRPVRAVGPRRGTRGGAAHL